MDTFYFTDAGLSYASQTADGKILEFTKGKFGDLKKIGGEYPPPSLDYKTMTDLLHPLGTLTILNKEIRGNKVTISTEFSNQIEGGGTLDAFRLMEMGLFARLLDENGLSVIGPETLVAYAFETEENKADYITNTKTEYIINWPYTVSNAENVEMTLSSMIYAEREELNLKADKETLAGGFSGGREAVTTTGGAVGANARAGAGFAGGQGARVGDNGDAPGAAIGGWSFAGWGFAGGEHASANGGGAAGYYTKTGDGFAGGKGAKTVDSNDNGIDAVQLGEGVNATPKTLQVYDYPLLDADGNIPAERIQDSLDLKADKQTVNGGFVAGEYAWVTGAGAAIGKNANAFEGGAVGLNACVGDNGGAVGKDAVTVKGGAVGSDTSSGDGGAVGNNASATRGGAIGEDAHTSDGGAVGRGSYSDKGGAIGERANTLGNGGAVGRQAQAGDGFAGGNGAVAGYIENSNGIINFVDAIQLGTGINSNEKTLQVYDYPLMDANGKIPSARFIETALANALIPDGKDNQTFNLADITALGITEFNKEKVYVISIKNVACNGMNAPWAISSYNLDNNTIQFQRPQGCDNTYPMQVNFMLVTIG